VRRENLATVNGYERNVHGRRDRPMGQRRSDRTLSTEGGTADDEIWTPCNSPVCPTTKNVAPKKNHHGDAKFSPSVAHVTHTLGISVMAVALSMSGYTLYRVLF